MAEAVLVYSQSHPTFLGANRVTLGYLLVRGDDPSSGLLESLQKDGFGFKPGSESAESGREDGYMISIGPFAPTSSTTAMGELSADSRDLGAAVESYTVTRENHRWKVDGYRLVQILFVATPAAYVRAER